MAKGAYWIPIGAGFGVAIGAALDNLALWMVFGAAFGVVMAAIQAGFAKRDDN